MKSWPRVASGEEKTAARRFEINWPCRKNRTTVIFAADAELPDENTEEAYTASRLLRNRTHDERTISLLFLSAIVPIQISPRNVLDEIYHLVV